MFPYSKFPQPWHSLELAGQNLQLALWQHAIQFNRAVRRGRLWVAPLLPWWWLTVVAFVVGAAGGWAFTR